MFTNFILALFLLPLAVSCNEGYSNQTEPSELKYFEMWEENKTAIFEWSDTKREMVPLHQEDDECIYRGSLREDPSSRVLVTGCEWEDRSIQIHSVLYGDTLATSVNGSVELLQEHGNLLMNDMVENDEFLQQLHQEQLGKRIKREYVINPNFRKQFPISNNANRNLIMPKLLDLPINIYLAPSWRSKFGGLIGGKSKAKHILSHVKLWFLHPSLDTKINIIYLDSNIFSTSADLIPGGANLRSLKNFVSTPPSGYAAIVYLTGTTDGSTLGMGYAPAICSKDKKLPRSMSGWHDSDIHTAQTVAHEIGHNLGYFHDFDTTTLTGRNKPCGPGQWNNGPDNDLMNYASNSVLRQNKWSDCTNEDFRNYFAQVTSKSGSSFCLEGSLSVKLVSGYPYLSTGAAWKPICGHYFWDNNNGASLFCKKLGYSLGGSVTKEGQAYAEDAHYVGRCGSGDIADFETGCTKLRESDMLTRCQKGNNVSIKITCKEPELNGYCLTSGGHDQNAGTQSLNAGDKGACYQQCKAVPQATGCEWHKDGGCIYHTLDVATGNGNSDYKCWVFNSSPTEKLWRDDGRCGVSYPLPNGKPGQCDPTANANERGPCCSSRGWCGNSDAHCKCSSCVSYAVPTCRGGATLLSTSPVQDMVLCQDKTESTCERDFESLCPAGWNLCTPGQFNNRNHGWDYNWRDDNAGLPLGAIYCYWGWPKSAAHYGIYNSVLNTDQQFNCWGGYSSRPGCDLWAGVFACDRKDSSAVCCAPTRSCGDGLVQQEEDCDDGNRSNNDDCLNSCTWKTPRKHGISGC